MYIRQTIDGLLYVSQSVTKGSVQEKLSWTLNSVSEILVENWLAYFKVSITLLAQNITHYS